MLYSVRAQPGRDIVNNEPPLAAPTVRQGPDAGDPCMDYQWPASRLTRADMRKLAELRNRTGRPMTVLLHVAVSALYDLLSSSSPQEDGE